MFQRNLRMVERDAESGGGDDWTLLPVGPRRRSKHAGQRFVIAVGRRLAENNSSIMGAAGCSKSPDFTPTHPLRAKTRLVPSKTAASEDRRRTLWGTVRI